MLSKFGLVGGAPRSRRKIGALMNDDALAPLGRCLHQDIGLGAASPADLATRAIAFLSGAERAALRTYLEDALERVLPSEMKGKLNRAGGDLRFSSAGSVQFLRAVRDQLRAER